MFANIFVLGHCSMYYCHYKPVYCVEILKQKIIIGTVQCDVYKFLRGTFTEGKIIHKTMYECMIQLPIYVQIISVDVIF